MGMFLTLFSIIKTMTESQCVAGGSHCHLERPFVIPSVVEGSHEISPCTTLSRDDIPCTTLSRDDIPCTTLSRDDIPCTSFSRDDIPCTTFSRDDKEGSLGMTMVRHVA